MSRGWGLNCTKLDQQNILAKKKGNLERILGYMKQWGIDPFSAHLDKYPSFEPFSLTTLKYQARLIFLFCIFKWNALFRDKYPWISKKETCIGELILTKKIWPNFTQTIFLRVFIKIWYKIQKLCFVGGTGASGAPAPFQWCSFQPTKSKLMREMFLKNYLRSGVYFRIQRFNQNKGIV